MSHTDFAHLLSSLSALSPEPMRHLSRELGLKLAEPEKQPAGHSRGSLGAMHDATDELDEAVQHAMQMRQRPWRLPTGE
jgi:hypothetical protein